MSTPSTALPAVFIALICGSLLLAGCVPQGGSDGAPPEPRLGVEVQFVWPADRSRVTDEGVHVAAPGELPLRVRLRNVGNVLVAVDLDDLVMRPAASPEPASGAAAPEDDPEVEAVYAAPGTLLLGPGQVRELDFGAVSLFFGFACTVHLSGEIGTVDETRVASIAHDSRPLLVEL